MPIWWATSVHNFRTFTVCCGYSLEASQHPKKYFWGETKPEDNKVLKHSPDTSRLSSRLALVLNTIFHQCVILYTCSQPNSDGSVLKEFFIIVLFHLLVASLTLMALF